MTDSDRRAQRRSRVLKTGKLIFKQRTIVIDCAVRDLTSAGAHVRMAEANALPPELELLIVSEQVIYPARIQWQKGSEVGVSFTGPAQKAPLRKW